MDRWWLRTHGDEEDVLVAYFSMEFGVDPALPIYSGGLGILAGDQLKAAGDLGVPLVGVGLLYHSGYFRQRVDEDGEQAEDYPALDPAAAGLVREDARVAVEIGGEVVDAAVWRTDRAGVPLYLLDGGGVNDMLYGGDREHRLRQELLLGLGGPRALAALGVEPSVWHLNEGHSAFLAFERIRALVQDGRLDFDAALRHVRATTVFTTHTPVPAGNEVFDTALVRRYLEPTAAACDVPVERLLQLGAAAGAEGSFGLTPLALRLSARANGVSRLHGDVARRMWADLDGTPEPAPIDHVTNGVHPRTWVSGELATLLRQTGVELDEAPDEAGWDRASGLDRDELWRVHRERKRVLLDEVAARTGTRLDPEGLTIGFARRFATYKRAGLIIRDAERVGRLLADPERPLQLLVAGKAHPADEDGKRVLAEIVAFSRDPLAAGRVVFLENYEAALAALLVQGVDVWLNNPRRPLEASGTSGMKAALNGAPNVSTLDGWWAEAADAGAGWTIGGADDYEYAEEHAAADAEALLDLLEREVLPAFYERGAGGLATRWLELMRGSIVVGGRFTSQRMVCEYVDRMYLPTHRDGAAARLAGRA